MGEHEAEMCDISMDVLYWRFERLNAVQIYVDFNK